MFRKGIYFIYKQAGTCVSCKDLSVHKEYLHVKRDGIDSNFAISKYTFKSLSFAQDMPSICLKDISNTCFNYT